MATLFEVTRYSADVLDQGMVRLLQHPVDSSGVHTRGRARNLPIRHSGLFLQEFGIHLQHGRFPERELEELCDRFWTKGIDA